MTQPYNSDISRNRKFSIQYQFKEAMIALAERETSRDGNEAFPTGWPDNPEVLADLPDDLIAYAVDELGAVVAEPEDIAAWDGQEWHKYDGRWVRIR